MKSLLCGLLVALLLVCPLSPAAHAETFDPENATDARLAALELIKTCGFSAEFEGERGFLVRWEKPILIYAGGQPTQADLDEIDAFLMELAFRVPMLPNIRRTERKSEANATIYFVPEADMGDYVTDYVAGNWGFVYFWYIDSRIDHMQIAIASDTTDQFDRNHLIREEIVNGLGLINDHYLYTDSIVYQEWTGTQTLSEVDWLMLNMLYHPDVTPGDNWETFSSAMYDMIYE